MLINLYPAYCVIDVDCSTFHFLQDQFQSVVTKRICRLTLLSLINYTSQSANLIYKEWNNIFRSIKSSLTNLQAKVLSFFYYIFS